MNFSEMTGYEFEDYISGVLRQYGFSVSKTSYSHDGGIDLLAIYEKPLFAGKYIIQCKNWVGVVGQPEVRDLYGVVMSERANKGILITPSDFTEQAYEFAKDKNIELVNGKVLHTILGGVSVSEECKPDIKKSKSFNYDQYNYLNDKIENEPTEPKNYLNLILFLRNYILNGDSESILTENILDRIVDLNERLMKRCYKRKNDIEYRRACLYRIAEIEIIRGNLGKATNILLDNGWFYIDRWYPNYWFTERIDSKTAELNRTYYRTLAENLFVSYKMVGCEFACQEQIKKEIPMNVRMPWCSPTHIPTVLGKECYDYEAYIRDDLEKRKSEYDQLKLGKTKDVFYFSLPSVSKNSCSYGPRYSFSHGVRSQQTASVEQFRKDYYSKSNSEIIDEIGEAFRQHGIDF